MKKSKYSDSQIAPILKEAEVDQPVTEICRKYGKCGLRNQARPKTVSL